MWVPFRADSGSSNFEVRTPMQGRRIKRMKYLFYFIYDTNKGNLYWKK
jgi:hypothetical protein